MSTTTPNPSLRTNPLAEASNALQRPSGASMLPRENDTLMPGSSSTFAPAASARSASPRRMLWQARCSATSEEQQAASMTMLGPWRASACDRRPAMTLRAVPRIEYRSLSWESADSMHS
ncbi:hypothetical protein GCM10020001_063290 [Nonomuraea salmonea]